MILSVSGNRPPAAKKFLRAFTNGEAPEQFALPCIGLRFSLLILYLQQGTFILQANSEDPEQTA